MTPDPVFTGSSLGALFILAIPIATIAWTVTHEEVFREPREWCERQSKRLPKLYQRKFFYLFTCEYCFSHWVTLLMLVLTRYTLLYEGWLGYVVAGFSLVWVANVYMGLFGLLRLDIKHERVEIAAVEAGIADVVDTPAPSSPKKLKDKPSLRVDR
jgi:hypothetical protein